MDDGMNTDFKVKPLPKEDKVVCSQSLPVLIHLREILIVELAVMDNFG